MGCIEIVRIAVDGLDNSVILFYIDFLLYVCYHKFKVLFHTDVNGGSLCAEGS